MYLKMSEIRASGRQLMMPTMNGWLWCIVLVVPSSSLMKKPKSSITIAVQRPSPLILLPSTDPQLNLHHTWLRSENAGWRNVRWCLFFFLLAGGAAHQNSMGVTASLKETLLKHSGIYRRSKTSCLLAPNPHGGTCSIHTLPVYIFYLWKFYI